MDKEQLLTGCLHGAMTLAVFFIGIEQKGSAIEQGKETLSLIDELYQKQIKWMSERMDQGDAVRSKEFKTLEQKVDRRFDKMEAENKSQNTLLADIVEFLNGDFQEFERKKKGRRK